MIKIWRVITHEHKRRIIEKEVVDASAIVIGKVKDVEVELETQTLEAIIIGKGGILESLGISKMKL